MAFNPTDVCTREYKMECALKKLLIAGLSENGIPGFDELKVLTGENADPKNIDSVICIDRGGPEEVKGTGNYLDDCEVQVVSSAHPSNSNADPMGPHRRRVAQARRILWTVDDGGYETLHARLSEQIDDFTVFPEIEDMGSRTEIDGGKIITTISFRACCCESDVLQYDASGNIINNDADGDGEPDEELYPGPPDPDSISLNGLRWELPCISNTTPQHCQCADPANVEATMNGRPGERYDVTLRFRGVVETKDYTGGSNNGAHFQTGGSPAVSGFNVYKLEVSDPVGNFYLNRFYAGQPAGDVIAIDYAVTIQINNGATVRLVTTSVDSEELRNLGGLEIPDIENLVPNQGQFIQMDVLDIQYHNP